MQAAIIGSREQVSAEVEVDVDSPINEVQGAFENTTLSITRDNKIVKGKFLSFFFVFHVFLSPLYIKPSVHESLIHTMVIE